VFRGKFVDGLEALYAAGELDLSVALRSLTNPELFAALLRSVYIKDWVVYCKPPFRGAAHALRYLGSYTHRIAISNYRLTELRDGKVTFRWRDSAHGNQQRLMTIPTEEFLRRFLLHVLPPGFVRIRYFGFFAHRRRTTLVPLCFALLARTTQSVRPIAQPVWQCPLCGGAMIVIQRLSRLQALLRSPPRAQTPEMGEAL